MSIIHKSKDGRLHIYVRQDMYKGKLKSENWVGRTFVDKKQKVISSGTKNLDEAKVILEKWYDDLVSGALEAKNQENDHISDKTAETASTENITVEIEEEDDEHQFFYTVGSGLDVFTEYSNFDGDGNPLGTLFALNVGSASSGGLTFTLRHEPNKPNSGLENAGGSTDIEVTFDVTVE